MFGLEGFGGGYESYDILKPSEIKFTEIEPLSRSLLDSPIEPIKFPEVSSINPLDPATPFGRNALGLDTFETTNPYSVATEGEKIVPRYENGREHTRSKEVTITNQTPKTKRPLKETPSKKGENFGLNPEKDLEGIKKDAAEISKPKTRKTNSQGNKKVKTTKKSGIHYVVDKKTTGGIRNAGAENLAKVKQASTGKISVKVNDLKSPELAKLADYYRGQEALANVKNVSTGNISVNVTNRKSPELTKMADFYRKQAKTAQNNAKKQAIANVKNASTGKISVKVNDLKSPELAKLADYYRGQEALANVKKASTGNISVNVTNRKSPELTRMADFYRRQAKTAQNNAKKAALEKVKKVFSQKPEFSPEALEQRAINGITKKNVWAMDDMKKYYQELEASSNKGIIAFLKKNKKTAIFATAALAVIGLATYIMHNNSAKADKTA